MAEPSEIEETLVFSPDSDPADNAPRPVLVEGQQPALSSAVSDLLRDRLKIASILLFLGFSVFFVLNRFLMPDLGGPVAVVLEWTHLAVILVAGLTAYRLCTNCRFAMGHLRMVEWLLFGLPVVLFTLSDLACLFGDPQEVIDRPISPKWILLTFIYALFIPNRWQRAIWPIGTLTAIPVVLVLAAETGLFPAAWHGSAAHVRHAQPLELSLLMLVTAAAATTGVHTINSLREEAFEARQLGQYQLSKKLGSGGMGEVYLAEHMLLKRPCAIKVIRPDHAGDSRMLARFEREVQATSRLTHWNTVEIFDYGRAQDGTFYYVMEYLPGMNLEQLVAMHGPLPAERVIHLMTQLCEALEEAHASGLIHRDIKPANIFAAHRGGVYDVAKLLDFGLARPLTGLNDSELTQEGTITGSPLYTSPEQAVGDPADERSDIYSLGAVAWWLLTGRPVFEDENPVKLLVAHATRDTGRPSDVQAGIPEDLENIVVRCLRKKPEERFQSATDLRHALLSCTDAARWSRRDAREWWMTHGCPQKKQLDRQVLQDAVA